MFAEDIYGPLRAIAMATNTDETRDNLNGVLFEITNERVRMVSTDGRMLGLCDVTAVNGALGTFLIPLATVQAALGAMKSLKKARANTPVTIGADVVIVGGVSIAYKGSDASRFPPYAQVIPSGDAIGVGKMGVTGHLIARVADMFEAVGEKGFAMNFRGTLSPIDCTVEKCALRVVLMPARVSETKNSPWPAYNTKAEIERAAGVCAKLAGDKAHAEKLETNKAAAQ